MATVIVGIGFVAVLQMVNYAVSSIHVSGERTKANYLVSMIAEGFIGYKDTIGGITRAEQDEIYYEGGKAYLESDSDTECKKFAEYYMNLGSSESTSCGASDSEIKKIKVKKCANRDEFTSPVNYTEIHKESAYTEDAATNKINKWTNVIEEDQVIKCRSKKDFKSVKIFEMCAWKDNDPLDGDSPEESGCDLENIFVYDEAMYVGRIQFNLNNGKKRKYLYFQADYKINQWRRISE